MEQDMLEYSYAQNPAPTPAKPSETKVFRVGDLQEHRYPYARAWKQGGWSSSETENLEDVARLVNSHYDPVNGRFKSHWEVLRDQEISEEKALEAASKKPAFVLPNNIVDDWTGSRYLEPCHGRVPCDEVVQPHKNLIQLDASLDMEADPFDPALSDVQKIMDRYTEKDTHTKVDLARMQLNGDPKGGVDNINLASVKHDQP